MALQYRAAVLHAAQTPMSIETVAAKALQPNDVLVRTRAAGLCHTDLEVIEGSLRYPLPIVLGHEAAIVAQPDWLTGVSLQSLYGPCTSRTLAPAFC